MAIYADDLAKNWPKREVLTGKWALSKPVEAPFIKRLKDAWQVLVGKCEAVWFAETYTK